MNIEVEGNKIVIYLTEDEKKYTDDIVRELEHIKKFVEILTKHGLD